MHPNGYFSLDKKKKKLKQKIKPPQVLYCEHMFLLKQRLAKQQLIYFAK